MNKPVSLTITALPPCPSAGPAVPGGPAPLSSTYDALLPPCCLRCDQQERVAILVQENKKLSTLAVRQKQFLYSLVHDLRSPLTVIMGYNELLQQRHPPSGDPLVLELLQRIQTCNQQQLQLINTLLDFAHGDVSDWPVHPQPLDLAALLAEEVELMSREADKRGLKLIGRCPPALPRAWADGTRVRQILRNLVGNALRHTPPGGSITLRGSQDGAGLLRIEVIDTGAGISTEHHASLFEPFWRAPAPSSSGQDGLGLGLGLFIARSLVERQGGEIGVQSEPGWGSAFWFTLPVAVR